MKCLTIFIWLLCQSLTAAFDDWSTRLNATIQRTLYSKVVSSGTLIKYFSNSWNEGSCDGYTEEFKERLSEILQLEINLHIIQGFQKDEFAIESYFGFRRLIKSHFPTAKVRDDNVKRLISDYKDQFKRTSKDLTFNAKGVQFYKKLKDQTLKILATAGMRLEDCVKVVQLQINLFDSEYTGRDLSIELPPIHGGLTKGNLKIMYVTWKLARTRFGSLAEVSCNEGARETPCDSKSCTKSSSLRLTSKNCRHSFHWDCKLRSAQCAHCSQLKPDWKALKEQRDQLCAYVQKCARSFMNAQKAPTKISEALSFGIALIQHWEQVKSSLLAERIYLKSGPVAFFFQMLEETLYKEVNQKYLLDFSLHHHIVKELTNGTFSLRNIQQVPDYYTAVNHTLSKLKSTRLKAFILMVHNEILQEFLFLKQLSTKFSKVADALLQQKTPNNGQFSCMLCLEEGTEWISPSCKCSFLKFHPECYKSYEINGQFHCARCLHLTIEAKDFSQFKDTDTLLPLAPVILSERDPRSLPISQFFNFHTPASLIKTPKARKREIAHLILTISILSNNTTDSAPDKEFQELQHLNIWPAFTAATSSTFRMYSSLYRSIFKDHLPEDIIATLPEEMPEPIDFEDLSLGQILISNKSSDKWPFLTLSNLEDLKTALSYYLNAVENQAEMQEAGIEL